MQLISHLTMRLGSSTNICLIFPNKSHVVMSVRYPISFIQSSYEGVYTTVRSSVCLAAYHFHYLFIFIKRTLNSCWLYANIPPYVRIFTEIYGSFFASVCVLMFRFCFTSICHIFKLVHRKTVHQRTGNRKQTNKKDSLLLYL